MAEPLDPWFLSTLRCPLSRAPLVQLGDRLVEEGEELALREAGHPMARE